MGSASVDAERLNLRRKGGPAGLHGHRVSTGTPGVTPKHTGVVVAQSERVEGGEQRKR